MIFWFKKYLQVRFYRTRRLLFAFFDHFYIQCNKSPIFVLLSIFVAFFVKFYPNSSPKILSTSKFKNVQKKHFWLNNRRSFSMDNFRQFLTSFSCRRFCIKVNDFFGIFLIFCNFSKFFVNKDVFQTVPMSAFFTPKTHFYVKNFRTPKKFLCQKLILCEKTV